MSSLNRRLALSNDPAARMLRWAYHRVRTLSLPAPAFLVRPLLAMFLALRALYYFLVRVFVCEPLFKAYCTKFGRGLRTGVYIHWVTGGGRLIIGDYVLVDGRCCFMFAVRYVETPTLSIGNHTIISHGCSLTVGREVSIGNHCLIASGVQIFDAPGHPTDPVLRKLGKPARPEDVRPIKIEDNVWVGRDSIVFPGVTIGEGSVVAVGSLVTSDVPPYTIVAGNPARVIARISKGSGKESAETDPFNESSPEKHSGGKESEDTLQAVTEVICQVVGTHQLDPDENFYDAGVTSIMVLPLLIEMEDRFHVTITPEQVLNARTPRVLSSQIAGLIGDQKLLQPYNQADSRDR
jgi:acetyltransferase-like isoleucine patch superfamily enzyme/acyl carrier protein